MASSFSNQSTANSPLGSRLKGLLISFAFWKWILLIAAFLVFGFILFWMSIPEVIVTRAKRGSAQDIVLGTVEVSEYHLLQLRSERAGTVIDAPVEIGDQVKEGQILLRLDTEEQQLQLERLLIDKDNHERTLAITRPSTYTLQKALEDLEEMERDVKRGIRPERDLELTQRNLQQLRENIRRQDLNEELAVKMKDAGIKQLRLDIEKMIIRSPVSGVVTNIYAREGDLVSAGAVAFEIIDDRRLVTAEISEEDFNKVREGLDSRVRFLAYPDSTFNAKVTQILPMADPITQRYKIYLGVDIEPRKLTPGLTGEVSIIVGERTDSLLIPSQAIIGNNVLRVRNSKVEIVRVTPGFRSLLQVEILDGIREGDTIIREELTRFRDGDLVRIQWSDPVQAIEPPASPADAQDAAK